MESLGIFEIILVVSVSVGSAVIIGFGFWVASNLRLSRQYAGAENIVPTFLFDGEDLKDATPDAQLLIKDVPKQMTDKQSVLHVLSTRFPMLEQVMGKLSRGETQLLTAADNTTISLEVAEIEGLIQLKMFGTCAQDSLTISEIAAQDALQDELSNLRNLTEMSPHLIWRQDRQGKLNWANRAYLEFSDSLSSDPDTATHSWPSEAIFPDLHHDIDATKAVNRRVSIDIPDQNGEAWFDVTTVKNGSNALHFAHCVNDAVSAEYAKRQSVQTFGRIFANLSTGLAIFDERQRLTMFNPALVAMTNLAPEFLSGKPTIQMFLDRLREARLLPEPKDYITWRKQFTTTDVSTDRGGYCENWEIADGQTFKVTGQSDRDGTYAFFFEDVSAELSLTRRFRSDIETGQGVLDALPEAIAVFSASGTLVMSNRAYSKLWDVDHDTSICSYDLRAEMLVWQSQCAAAPIWNDLREFIGYGGMGGNYWTDRAVLDDGRQFTCKAQPISGGMTMISFTTSARAKPRLQKNLTMPDEAIYGL